MHTTHVRIYYLRYTYIWSGTIIMALYKYFKRGPYFPLYGRVVNKQTRRLYRQSRPEIKLSRLKASTMGTCRKGTGREVRPAENSSTKVARYFSKLLDNWIISEKAYVRRCVR